MPLPQLLAFGALAVYAGLRLRRLIEDKGRAPRPQDAHDTQGGRATKQTPIEDILEEDPICRRLVPRRQALTARSAGRVHYFCGELCRARFLQQTTQATQTTGEESKP